MYVYMRSIRVRITGSIFAALAYSLSGFATVRLIFSTYGLTLTLLPFSLAIIEAYRTNLKSRWIYALPFMVFSMIVSTQTQIVLYSAIIIGLYAMIRVPSKRLLRLVLMLLLGIGLAAVQLLPTYELMQLSHIHAGGSQDVLDRFSCDRVTPQHIDALAHYTRINLNLANRTI